MGMIHPKFMGLCSSKQNCSSTTYSSPLMEDLCHQFSLADLKKSTNNFHESQIRGGAFGAVYQGCLKHHNGATDYLIALKRVKAESNQEILEFKNEIELLCQLHHPNLISLIGFCDCKDEMIVVYEYMPNGSLYDHLYCGDMKIEPLTWKQRLKICIGAARGLHYLHTGAKRTIFHRDIKSHDILLDNNMVPKLANFGISLKGPHFMSKPKPIEVKSALGTYGYMAPEYAMTNTFTDKCDVYSFGMILLEVICTKDKQAIFDKVTKLRQNVEPGESKDLESFIACGIAVMHISSFVQRYPVEEIIEPILMGKIAPECWEEFMDITVRCLKFDPNERPIMGEVEVQLEHALSLQEEADMTKTCDDYTLVSTTIVNTQTE